MPSAKRPRPLLPPAWSGRRWRFLLLALLLPLQALSAQAKDSNPHGTMDVPCASCHTADAWKPARFSKDFDHAQYGGMVLDGGHGAIPCASCHKTLVFAEVAKTCVGCHQDVHRGELGLVCADCHNNRAFNDPSAFIQRHQLTRFPLDGAHRTLDCRSCHAARGGGGLVFRGAPTDCIGCHQDAFDRTTTPNHPAAGFPKDCLACHTNLTWGSGRFDHQTTAFPLTGAHRAATCQQCHADGQYQTKPTACVACHQTSFAATQTPPHEAARFATTCADCHTTEKWLGAPYDHNTTKFPLTGSHQPLACLDCHQDKVYVGKATTCVSCHQPEFAQTKTPPHQAAGIATTCADCHTTAKWVPGSFDHGKTRFPLTGAHLATPCLQCHADGVYTAKAAACVSCHQPAFAAAKAPPHVGFPTSCADCHTTTKWVPGNFNHAATAFPLTGAHLAASCVACHGDGVYRGKPATCVSCHQPDFTGAANPPHTGFQTTCADCHTTTKWTPATFNHGATRFPLTGAHLAAPCLACHGDGVYRGKPTTCVSCHQADYTATRQPAHQAAGFPTTCGDCHATTKWTPATFNHNATSFPLTGAHVTTPCQACHGDGVYNGKATTCVSCHQADFTATVNPNHQAAKIPTTCETCHTTSRWTGATFNHDGPYFRIYSGAHRGRWATCADCHTNPAAYTEFTCLTCHTKSRMDAQHAGRSGYAYTSAKCYSCHPRA